MGTPNREPQEYCRKMYTYQGRYIPIIVLFMVPYIPGFPGWGPHASPCVNWIAADKLDLGCHSEGYVRSM